MQYLIFSDTHLSAYNYDPAFCAKLKKLIAAVDRVIINGDFFDAYLSTFVDFRQSKWSALFPLLLKKKAVYIYGNHDRPEYMNENVTEFSVEQTYRKVLKIKRQQIVIQHGHLYAPDFDGKFPALSYSFAWLYPRYHYHASEVTWLYRLFLNNYNTNKNKLLHKELKTAIERFHNKNPTRQIAWEISGHSHIQDLDYGLRYLNSGSFSPRSAEYILLNTNGTMQLVKDSYVQTVAVV